MTPSPGIEPGPHWWEASALTTAPSLHPRIIINSSSKHKLQRLLALLYGLARAMICHVITWLILSSFNDQTYLLSSVEFLDAVFLNDAV